MKINMLDRVMDRIVVSGALASLMALLSCTAVEYGHIDTGDGSADRMETSKVVFNFDWSNAGGVVNNVGGVVNNVGGVTNNAGGVANNVGGENENGTETSTIPQMYVAMSRIVNEKHYVYLYDPSKTLEPDAGNDSGDSGNGSGSSGNGGDGNINSGNTGSENTGSGGTDNVNSGYSGDGSEGGATVDGPDGSDTASGSEPEGKPEDEPEEHYDLSVHNGDYYLAAFGCLSDADAYIYENLQQFESDNSVGMRALYAKVPQMKKDEFIEQFGNLSVDFNPSYPIIREASPLFVDVRKMSLYNSEKPIEVLFKPLDLTMTLVFRVRVNIKDTKDEPVEIKDISAEISGVPAKVQLMSGVITEDELCKVPFKMELKSEQGTGTNQNGFRSRQAVFEGSVRVFGLFASKYGTYISGPGILRLAVNAVAGKEENAGGGENSGEDVLQTGNPISGKAVERIFYAGINLKRVIEQAKPVVRLDNGTGYRAIHVVRYSDGSGFSSAGSKPIIIDVPDALNVSKDNVVSGGGGGLEQWFESDRDISTEV